MIDRPQEQQVEHKGWQVISVEFTFNYGRGGRPPAAMVDEHAVVVPSALCCLLNDSGGSLLGDVDCCMVNKVK